ncbi:segregation and condensation protein A [Butyribacter intestini]|jgi:segregation and condensation protein A|uniref:segregation and condensation protein A n=1 Tax=Butyribacter intestini TaxID=1703332 RepID=UPI0022E199CD|nr:segregation/condensation protein A [Butyribacter intestini]
MSSISVKLEVFDGPLDLLLHLIEKNKIDIFDIPIAEITRQYMEILSASETDDMDVMSDFLVMAATLLKIKSKMLLPVQVDEDGEEIDPRAELVERLLEYKTFKYASYELKDKQMDAEKILYKKSTIPKGIADYKETVDVSELLGDVTLARLRSIFNDVMKKQIDKIDPIRSKFGQIKKETVSLQDRMLYIEEYAMRHKSFSFRTMLEKNSGKTMVIVTFLGILELMKVGKLLIVQERIFDDIKITYNSLAPDVEYIPSSAG